MSEKQARRATGSTAVNTYEPRAFDEVSGGPTLIDVHLTETFSGDIEGDGVGRGLRGDGGFKADLGQHGNVWLDYHFEAAP